MNEQLRVHQRLMLGLLEEFDRVCKKHGIPYMLFAGTALGAVRHRGFIPWDDDLDVILLRPDYERFLALAPAELDPGRFYLQAEFSEHWPMFFTKLRLQNTACIEKFRPRDPALHQGVCMDVFPCDDAGGCGLVRRAQFLAAKVVIARSLYRRGYETKSPLKLAFMQLCRLLPQGAFWRLCVRGGKKRGELLHSFLAASSDYSKNIYPREWFEQTVELPFETGRYPVSAHYDELLTQLYGDYMTPPDPAQRKSKEHIAIFDPERSYTAYLEEQQTMRIETYTRSIR